MSNARVWEKTPTGMTHTNLNGLASCRVRVSCHFPPSVLVCLLPTPDIPLARLAVSAAAPAAPALPPQGHPIRQRVRDDDDSSDEGLFSQCRIMDHQPATEALRVRMHREVPSRSPREDAFRELAQRKYDTVNGDVVSPHMSSTFSGICSKCFR